MEGKRTGSCNVPIWCWEGARQQQRRQQEYGWECRGEDGELGRQTATEGLSSVIGSSGLMFFCVELARGRRLMRCKLRHGPTA